MTFGPGPLRLSSFSRGMDNMIRLFVFFHAFVFRSFVIRIFLPFALDSRADRSDN